MFAAVRIIGCVKHQSGVTLNGFVQYVTRNQKKMNHFENG
jgi:hypothetical protein